MEILSAIIGTISSIVGFAIGSKLCYKILGRASLLDDITKWVKK